MMSKKKIFGLSLMGVLSFALAGCGGGGGSAQPQPGVVPFANGQYNTYQGYNCQAGGIQLRNPSGYPQCFQQGIDLATACSQVRGVMVQNGYCRTERRIPGKFSWSTYEISLFRSRRSRRYDDYDTNSNRMVRIPLQAALLPGESMKLQGHVSASSGWYATLLQEPGDMAVGSAASDQTVYSNGDNLVITAMVYGPQYNNTQYNPAQVGGSCYASPNGVCNAGYYPVNGQCCVNGQTGMGMYQTMQQPSSQLFALDVNYDEGFDIDLHASAVSCSDGHGNSYPCQ